MTSLFPQDAPPNAAEPCRAAVRTGILPYQALQRHAAGAGDHRVKRHRRRPGAAASIDLRLGEVAYRVRASFLPGPDSTVLEKVRQLDG